MMDKILGDAKLMENLNDWLEGSDNKSGRYLDLNSGKFPYMFRGFKSTAYRGMMVDADFLNKLNREQIVFNNYSSWTTDQTVAKRFINDPKYMTSPKGSIKILLHKKFGNEVVLDIGGFASFVGTKDLIAAGIDPLAADSAVKEYELLLKSDLKIGPKDYTIL